VEVVEATYIFKITCVYSTTLGASYFEIRLRHISYSSKSSLIIIEIPRISLGNQVNQEPVSISGPCLAAPSWLVASNIKLSSSHLTLPLSAHKPISQNGRKHTPPKSPHQQIPSLRRARGSPAPLLHHNQHTYQRASARHNHRNTSRQ
jgi:hypothetical protein